MAYWQFDLTFVNLGALPEGSSMILIKTLTATGFEALAMDMISGAGDITISASTAEPGSTQLGSFPPFELIASDQVWFVVMLIDDTDEMTTLYSIGPYTVGDIGTEVPGPAN